MTYDLGDGVPLRYAAYTPDGAATTATVDLTVTKPGGGTITPSVTFTAPNLYDATVPADQVLTWFFRWDVSGNITDKVPGQFDVADSAGLTYATLDELKEMRRRNGQTGSDALFLRALKAASRSIDKATGRRFWLDSVATTRIFNPRGRVTLDGDLLIDDIGSMADLVVEIGFGSTWTVVDDYETQPENALARQQAITGLLRPDRPMSGWGYGSRYGWRYNRRLRVRITAHWGWPLIPDDIAEATLLLASRLYLRKDSPEGVAASGEWGAIRFSRWDPDVQELVGPYRLFGIG
jgi:hypothetical protein